MRLLESIKQRIESAQAECMPGSKLAMACAYVLGQWPKLTRIIDHGDVELDTNGSEQSVRPLVLGRKNWLHVGSWEAGPRVAAIASVIKSLKRLGINPMDYLADILPRSASGKMSDVPSLTPAAPGCATARAVQSLSHSRRRSVRALPTAGRRGPPPSTWARQPVTLGLTRRQNNYYCSSATLV